MHRVSVVLFALALVAGCKAREKAVPDAPRADAGTRMPVSSSPTPVPSSPVPAAASAKPTDGCIHVDADEERAGPTVLEGRVYAGKHGHPNGKMFTFYALTLARPMCVTGADGVTTVREVQLASTSDPATDLRKWDGTSVRVTGSAFPEETAWHVRPVVVSVKTIGKL